MLGLVCGFTGVVVLLGVDSLSGLLPWLGVACIVVATLGYAVGSLVVQRYLQGVDEFGAVALSLAIAAAVLLPPALLTLPSHMPSVLAVTSVAALGVICTALALWLYLYLISHAGATRAAVFTYINPAVATVLGATTLHEPVSVRMIAGMSLILLGSWMATAHR